MYTLYRRKRTHWLKRRHRSPWSQCVYTRKGPHVQTSMEHSLCMLEGLPEAGSTIRVGHLTTFAYQMTQATYNTDLVLKHFMIIYMGLSMRPEMDHCQRLTTTMYRVLCGTVPMIPAKTICPPSWTCEYNGYLMTEHYNPHCSMLECVDQNPETVPGGTGNQNGALFYHVEATCTGIVCPPYIAGRPLACTVCTKWTNCKHCDNEQQTLVVNT